MITKKDIKELYAQEASPSVSIYIPTYRAGRNQEDQLRFKNALKEAHEKLMDAGMDSKAAHKMLANGYELLDQDDFWMHLSDGLAVFVNPDRYEQFILPTDVSPQTQVGQKFYLRPLIPAITGKQRFFLLALSQNEVRFFEGNKYSISPVIIDDLVPENMEEALALDERENNLQSHSGRSNTATPIFHGSGLGKDHKLKRLRQYFRQIDDGLMEMLHDEDCPLVIAGVDYLIPIYKEVSKYNNIINQHIGGNPEHDDPIMLHEKAWTILDEFNTNEVTYLKRSFPELLSRRKASTEFSTILRASEDGQVETLFINKDQQIWGQYNAPSRSMMLALKSMHNNEDLLERTAMNTLMHGGKVYNVSAADMPESDFSANAILRYNLA
jgi:hypothetical protein